MFFGALAMIFTGYPVAFALGGTALLFAVLGSAVGAFDLVLLYALPERTFGTMSNSTLLAVPFFIFMGAVLEKSRLEFDIVPNVRSGRAKRRGMSKTPIAEPISAKINAVPPNANATG